MKCKSVIAVVLLAVTVIATEEHNIQAQEVDKNAADITSASTDVEEGRIRHHHLLGGLGGFGHHELLPFYGGLCKFLLL